MRRLVLLPSLIEAPAASFGDRTYRLPAGHQPVMRRPARGQFLCRDCRYVSGDGERCSNTYFVEFQGGEDRLPFSADDMCSDWFEPKEQLDDLGPEP